MLAKAAISPDPISLGRVLHDDLVVDSLVPVCDQGPVARQQPRVNTDFRDVERVRASEEAQAVHIPAESAEGAIEDVRAVTDLSRREILLTDEEACFSHRFRYSNDLWT